MSPTLNVFDVGDTRATVIVVTDVEGKEVAATLRGFGHVWQGQHNSTHAVIIVFAPGPMVRLGGNIWENGPVPTLRAEAKRGDAEPHIAVLAFDGYNQSVTEDVYRALRIGIDSGDCIMEPTMQVRRLTPIECERLMGWPDNHTAIGTNGPISDTNRYKMCGNGVASPVAQWIGEQLMAIHSDAEGSRSDAEGSRPDAE